MREHFLFYWNPNSYIRKGHRHATLPGNVDICCFVFSKFDEMTNEDLWDAHDELEKQKPLLGKTRFEALETALGVNYSPEGVLASPLLRAAMHPVESHYDRMHNLESGGISEHEVNLLLQSLSDSNKFSNAEVQRYCNASWRWGRGSILNFSFRDNKLKGMANDVLSAVPILFHFAKSHLQNWEEPKVESFEALFLAFKQIEYIKHTADCSPAACLKLKQLFERHLELFQKAYSESDVKPKHHYNAHLADQYLKDGFYEDCFAPERHQKLMKAIAEKYTNPTLENYEFFVISQANQTMLEEVNYFLEAQPTGRSVQIMGEPSII